ncbi:MAG: hypothetical protein D6785_11175, partial [Planctomycetota bacterium]
NTVALLLSLNHIDYQKDCYLDTSPPHRALKKLLTGKLDCLFFTGGSPLAMLSGLSKKEGQKLDLLSLTKEEFGRSQFFFARLGLPRPYYWVKIPKTTYSWQTKDIFTLATPALLVGRIGHQEKTLFRLLEAIFSQSSSLRHPKWKGLKYSKVRKQLVRLPIPLHGSVRMYLYKQNLKQIQSHFDGFQKAIALYQQDNNKLPSSLMALVKAPKGLKTWKGPYLKMLPKDPWGNSYVLKVPGRWAMDYEILSLGRDGKKGGKGMDRDLSSWEGNLWMGQIQPVKGEKFSPEERKGDQEGD